VDGFSTSGRSGKIVDQGTVLLAFGENARVEKP
jgi:hypothetical protein